MVGVWGEFVPWDEKGGEDDVEFPIFSTQGFIGLGGDEATDEAEEDIEDDHDSG